MFFNSHRLRDRQDGLDRLKQLFKDKNRILVIHYSCESFITNHGRTPRVTSISIRHYESGQTTSFSIHLQAQFEKKDINNLTSEDFDELEKKMLDDFYSYIEKNKDCKWVHWKMRDSNYGFQAISNRYKILGGNATEIDEDKKYDISRILVDLYTSKYEKDKPDGKMLNLANRNDLTTMDALKGSEESKAFEGKEYLKLHKSALRKVGVISTILELTYKSELKVASSKSKIYGMTIPGIIEIVKNNWILLAIWSVLIFILGTLAQNTITSLMNNQ
jgi:hypothetical protein